MFFKNIFVFALTRPFTTTDLELHAALGHHEFTPLGSTELRHFGWVRPIGKVGNFTNMLSGNTLICARSEEKILPSQVVKDLVDERLDQLEAEFERPNTKKEREQVKEDVIFELLPRAFSRTVDTHAYINTKENIIVVNTSSRGKAEDVLALLRKTLGTLPVTSISPVIAPDEAMTNWLNAVEGTSQNHLGENFTLGYEAELVAIGDHGSIAKVKNTEMFGSEVRSHLDADKYVTKIELIHDNCMSFILNDDLSIKRIKFFDVIAEQNDDIDSDDAQGRLEADFTLMAGELNRMIGNLHAEFGVIATDYLEA